MSEHPAFELVREQQIGEISSLAKLYRHKKTGAEVLSLINEDENKVFGVTLKTPPEDSTGVAHILEHSVLCGSRKYPVKKPFVELLKGSLHTFLNAMTFSDKTAYPVASQNLKDFYNLVDVYLDAVYFPLISEDTFRQEGWHYELDSTQGPMVYKGVVFNEMKGAYSSAAAVLGKVSQLSLYPDTTYGVNSGGDPKAIPDLTYEYFKNFHAKFYHPSNSRVVFYGDDDPAKRLEILEEYFSQFEPIEPKADIPLQPRWSEPRQFHETYAASPDEAGRKSAMVTVNWMLDEVTDPETLLALNILESVLVGTPAAPLRKALIDSGLGEGLTGSGLADGIQQPYFTFGLKGIADEDGEKVQELIIATLEYLSVEGIDPKTIEAAVNTAEFGLRENNTGSFPRGIALMFRSLGTWLYGGDPLAPLSFEVPLKAIKDKLAAGEKVFEGLIKTHILDNKHRTTVLLTADPDKAAKESAAERARLDAAQAGLDASGLAAVAEQTRHLKELQEQADPPEALARIPTLTLEDLPRANKAIPIAEEELAGITLYTHELPTNGVVYLDVGFNLDRLPGRLLPYLPLFTRALTQTGTSKEDFVSLTQRIGQLTGGVGSNRWISTRRDGSGTAAWLFVRGKATPDHVGDLLAILHDVITDARLDNRERIRQMVLESKAGFESSLAGMGNGIVSMRVRAGFSEADWLNEKLGGVSHYFFLKDLAAQIDGNWPAVQAALEEIRSLLLGRSGMIANATADSFAIGALRPQLESFVKGLPGGAGKSTEGWGFTPGPQSEGLTFPGQVNYVAKGANLKELGFEPTGGTAVAIKHLNTTYMWDKVRVQGGAYGGSSGLDPFAGTFAFTSYRDPNLLETIDVYDKASSFLKAGVGEQDLVRSVIGVIGTVDTYRLPDAKGFTSLAWELAGDTEEARQKRREEILGATNRDFKALAEALDQVARQGQVVVLGSEKAIKAANDERGGFLKVTKVL
ncbi:insulinase family protein [Devosia sp. ZB163]|uniref:insulinase family protein n=1 Tax=Devosia sp. ZB163 TaxID=3025938 RepID=UPI0023618D11|nr:insulinase family protein [Devosia sp. ZB163]MDC9824997.1 insulinase family protein [Devosia sp. ZB163]